MSSKILLKTITEFRKSADANPQVRLARNAAVRGDVMDLAMDWEAFRRIDHTFSDIVTGQMKVTNQKSIVDGIRNLIESPEEMPNLLFSGPAGVGKTTVALCITREILGDYWKDHTLELNASDERGINMVRERVKMFARYTTITSKIPFKIVILDEADEMTSDAQTALRRIIEDSARSTRFILICNYLSQINISP